MNEQIINYSRMSNEECEERSDWSSSHGASGGSECRAAFRQEKLHITAEQRAS
jgi:hypothetical protein